MAKRVQEKEKRRTGTSEDNLYTFNHYSFMSNCILCNEELKSPCEELFGVCKKDAPKVKQILSTAMSLGGFGK